MTRTRAVLGVDQSPAGLIWVPRLDQSRENVALAMSQRTDIPDVVARVLAGRDVSVEESGDFLDPSLKALMPDPSCLQDMDKASERLADAIRNREKIAIFGDYDVDGACSSALAIKFLRQCGLDPVLYIPDRLTEGYGPNPAAIQALVDQGATLIVSVDCGTSSFDSFDLARSNGVDVVVLDHHQCGERLPDVVALVNPNRQDDLSGLGHLCAAGVVFLTLVALNRTLRQSGFRFPNTPPPLLEWLDLVALATVCDVVPLQGLNRAFVRKGLIALRHLANQGLAALARASRINGPLQPYHLGFLLGPRINAGGRIGDAALGAKLLLCQDTALAERMAQDLDRLNGERQAMEAVMLEEADAQAFAQLEDRDPAVLVTVGETWHPGIVGLIASRLKERYRRPCFAIALDESGAGAGSGRSIAGVDLGQAVRSAVDTGLLVKGGGHAMAAGLTVDQIRLDELKAYFQESLGAAVAEAGGRDELVIDGTLTASGATLNLLEVLENAGPFGSGHPEPVFAFPTHRVRYASVVGQGHVRCQIEDGSGGRLKAIAFRCAETPLGRLLLESREAQAIHIAGMLSVDHWQGDRKVQLRITDAAPVR
ncbi:single-stranded-DNA-specific exonuclease RecJ [Coralliovum pocilloporae]|uniref:single-stranded-DNA-specific exonuclease RecJ n=1 Tax=Coralliovum pocilloporae TaxID=3066369 RepID=UPI00330719D2